MSAKTTKAKKTIRKEEEEDVVPYNEEEIQPSASVGKGGDGMDESNDQQEPSQGTQSKVAEITSTLPESGKTDEKIQKQKRITKSKRAGLHFGVGRIEKLMNRSSDGVGVCITSIFQDLYELLGEWAVVLVVRAKKYDSQSKKFEIDYPRIVDAGKTFDPFRYLNINFAKSNTLMGGIWSNALNSNELAQTYDLCAYSKLIKKNQISKISASSSANEWHNKSRDQLVFRPALNFSHIYIPNIADKNREYDEEDIERDYTKVPDPPVRPKKKKAEEEKNGSKDPAPTKSAKPTKKGREANKSSEMEKDKQGEQEKEVTAEKEPESGSKKRKNTSESNSEPKKKKQKASDATQEKTKRKKSKEKQ